MTETANGTASQGGTSARSGNAQPKGLTLRRIYTREGVHPYDDVTWERRDVVMTNWRDGSVNFEQYGVEFPDFWSVNAANIVTTKYFRGAVGTPQREWSLKQLVDRVVDTYTAAGREHGYFATKQDAEIFEHELKHALVHQVFSFNSPVWFNVGTTSPQQVSACQPYDAPVSTPSGPVEIGRLVAENAVGAKVYDAYGATRIVATKANGVKEVLRVHTTAGHVLDATPDHLVWRATDLENGEFTVAGFLRPGDHLLYVHPDVGGSDRVLLDISKVENLGPMEVYDIQTESGEYLSGNLRVHNCFILAVDDTMDSILEWYREEGLIFKGGSGAGVNLSRIRSSKELLTSGGTASGPVSFMRGADASAGTIKSGGATRRAAKMVVLDVDHPDVEEFIETKAREEEKIRVLRDGGFDMDLGGKDIASVQYQNANNSVRVSDEFMRAVESGGRFDLNARTTGEPVAQVDARELFGKMAKAAWECADPGIQYDGTINDWHTCPESGRITASNPCFPSDQRVVTDQGLIRIGDLVARAANGEQFAIYTNEVTSAEAPSECVVATRPVRYMVTGLNEILELRFSDGSRLRCTPAHRIWTANKGWVHAEELEADDRVVRSLQYAARSSADAKIPRSALDAGRAIKARSVTNLPEKWDEELGYYLGWLVGDGCVTDQNAVTIYGTEGDRTDAMSRHAELLERITGFSAKPSVQANGTLQLRVTRDAFVAFVRALGVSSGRAPAKMVPQAIFEAPEEALLGFLRGLFDADGCIVNLRNGTRYVGLGSRSEELLLGVQELLGSLGIASRIYQSPAKKDTFSYVRKDGTKATYSSDGPSFDLRIAGRSLREFGARIGFGLSTKDRKLVNTIASTRSYNTDETIRLVSRQSRGFETTYNLTEPRNHSYVVGGVVVANCSEYVHLDNSSCNLASINLLKFLRDDDTFEVERFSQVTELIITAMDISICFADFPTEKITETTRAYRQLGIGYANLGALLMATGHAYDSDGGRAIAAAITSLMTGMAYKRSAELAGVVGPYDGYARNAAAHKRVIDKHLSASAAVKPAGGLDEPILSAANEAWWQCKALGESNGYRNAQASLLAPTGTIGLMMDCDTTGIEPDLALVKFKKLVGGGSMQIVNQTVPRALKNLGYQDEQAEAIIEFIAEHGHVVDAPGLRPEHYEVFDCAMGERAISPMGHVRMMAAVQPALSGAISKCVTGDTLVASSEGLVRIGSLHQSEDADTFREEFLEISSLDGDRKTDAFYYGGLRPVRRVVLRSGHTVTGTDPHRLLVAGKGELIWKTLAEIQPGDSVAIQYGAEKWASTPFDLSGITVSEPHGNQKAVVLPTEMTTELAFLLGAYASEGHTTRANWTINITNSVPSVLQRVRDAWLTVFGLESRIAADPGKCPQVVVSSKAVVEFMSALGCGTRSSEKRIPDAILRSPREMVVAFLRGLALDAYVTTATAAKWAICLDSPRLLDDLQAVMTNLGILHGRVTKHNSDYDKDYDEVYAAGLQGQLMVSLIPFLEPDKSARAAEYLRMDCSAGTADVVPGVSGRELYELIPPSRRGVEHGRSWRQEFTFLLDSRTQHVTRRTLERLSTLPGVVLPAWLQQVIDGNMHFSPVESVTDAGEAEVFDLSVPVTHAFVANGIVNHNTVNLPESATIADIEKIYLEGWKLGLKALAIYRDNCKVGQPLSVSKKSTAEKAEPAAATPHEVRPVRRRLPRQRTATVTRFSVAGAEGYMTASSYPDDGIGEVFLKLGKQGSTLAGVMDAFSMAISVGLQYGIPLESYVGKFTNMRFEPAGMTDDPDIRMASSVMDYIFRRLALDHLAYDARSELGILNTAERTAQLNGEDPAAVADEIDPEELAQSAQVEKVQVRESAAVTPKPASTPQEPPAGPHSSTELIESQLGRVADAPLCLTCGTKMRPAGSCYVCEGCGSTSGCS
jgi:ribonucleotide reductase alpha subunit